MQPHQRPSRDRILDAAEQVFSESGYRGGSLNDVAVAAGYTRAGLLHHYPSKAAVLMAILERRDERLGVTDFGRDAEDVDDLMHTVERRYVEQAPSIRPLIKLGHIVEAEAASTDHPAHEWAASRERELRSAVSAVVKRSQDQGTIRADIEPQVLASVILAVVEGLESQWLLDESVDLAAGVRLAREMLRAQASPTP